MGTAQMTVTMREKFEAMIAGRFNSLLTEVEALHQVEKEELMCKVKKEFGLYELEAKVAATTLQLNEMKILLTDRAGPYSSNVKAEVNKRLEEKMGYIQRLWRREQSV